MARSRIDLQTVLENVLGSRNVYYQPPPNIDMNYPCIVYKDKKPDKTYANNQTYISFKSYELTYIDEDPESVTKEVISRLPMCEWINGFQVDDLNHDVYILYF